MICLQSKQTKTVCQKNDNSYEVHLFFYKKKKHTQNKQQKTTLHVCAYRTRTQCFKRYWGDIQRLGSIGNVRDEINKTNFLLVFTKDI